MLNIVVPMAGEGKRFADAGYKDPKPLIQIFGKPMISHVVKNITPEAAHRFIFICQKEHLNNYRLEHELKKISPQCLIFPLEKLTAGAACSVLAAKDIINSPNPLMIANSDQFCILNINHYLEKLEKSSLDGLIMTMWADDPKWSFVECGNEQHVIRVVEKEVISNEATVGVYNFKHGKDFVQAAEEMIANNIRVKNEFYVAPVYNQLIKNGSAIGYHNVGRINETIFGLGTPDDLSLFINMPCCKTLLHN